MNNGKFPNPHYLKESGYRWLIFKDSGDWHLRKYRHEVNGADFVISVDLFLSAGEKLEDISQDGNDVLLLHFDNQSKIILTRGKLYDDSATT